MRKPKPKARQGIPTAKPARHRRSAEQMLVELKRRLREISDLTAAMGINPPSLYATFGDKERLFLEAVERYSGGPGDTAAALAAPGTALLKSGRATAAVACCSFCVVHLFS